MFSHKCMSCSRRIGGAVMPWLCNIECVVFNIIKVGPAADCTPLIRVDYFANNHSRD